MDTILKPVDGKPPVGRLDSRLLAGRARAEILQAIFDGRFESKLPNEDRLAEMLDVSRTTVRTALQGLERDGIITRRRSIGTIINKHVRPSSLALQRLVGFDSLLSERGYAVEIDVSSHWGPAGSELAAIFGIDADEECLLMEKAYCADETLALVITDAIPAAQVLDRDISDRDIDASLFTFSQRRCRAAIHHAVVKLIPRVKTRKANTKLEIAVGTAFLRLHEVHYSSAGEQVAFSVIDLDDSYIQLEVARTE
jgi:GntR family transcriptional regulator